MLYRSIDDADDYRVGGGIHKCKSCWTHLSNHNNLLTYSKHGASTWGVSLKFSKENPKWLQRSNQALVKRSDRHLLNLRNMKPELLENANPVQKRLDTLNKNLSLWSSEVRVHTHRNELQELEALLNHKRHATQSDHERNWKNAWIN